MSWTADVVRWGQRTRKIELTTLRMRWLGRDNRLKSSSIKTSTHTGCDAPTNKTTPQTLTRLKHFGNFKNTSFTVSISLMLFLSNLFIVRLLMTNEQLLKTEMERNSILRQSRSLVEITAPALRECHRPKQDPWRVPEPFEEEPVQRRSWGWALGLRSSKALTSRS